MLNLKVKQRLLMSRPGYMYVVAYVGPYVERRVKPFRHSLLGKTIGTINVPEFELCEPVRMPTSVSDYPRYRATVLAATQRCKSAVVRRYLKKYPLGAC